jgi:hypothetical protein
MSAQWELNGVAESSTHVRRATPITERRPLHLHCVGARRKSKQRRTLARHGVGERATRSPYRDSRTKQWHHHFAVGSCAKRLNHEFALTVSQKRRVSGRGESRNLFADRCVRRASSDAEAINAAADARTCGQVSYACEQQQTPCTSEPREQRCHSGRCASAPTNAVALTP